MRNRIVIYKRVLCGLALLALCSGQVFGAISAAMVWEVQTDGSDANNSGGFRGGAFVEAPSAPSVSNITTGGSVAANTYYFVYTYTDGLGDTVISSQTSTTTTGGTSTITATSPSTSTGAMTWNCYVGTTDNGPYFPQGTGLLIGSNRVITTTPPTSGTQPRGVDRSLSTTRFMILDNSTITATTAGAASNVITFTGYTPTGVDVGNIFRATAGTNINVGFYEITAVTTTTWTVTGSTNLTTGGGAGSAIVGGMGGCFASLGQAGAVNAGSVVFIKNGTYTIANGTVNTAGNKYSLSYLITGYSTNRNFGNKDTKPVLAAGAASMTMVTATGNATSIETLSFTNPSAFASVTGLVSAVQSFYRNLSFSGLAIPISAGGQNHFADIYTTGCGSATIGNGSQLIRFVSVNCTTSPTATPVGSFFKECIFINPSQTVIGGTGYFDGCIFVNASGASVGGLNLNGGGCQAINCIAWGNNGTGFVSGQNSAQSLTNCASGGNGTDFDSKFTAAQKINCITLTANPFVNAAGNDFSLNTTAGGGAACRAAGVPGAFVGLDTTTGHRDIGAVQHADPAGGGFIPGPMMAPGALRPPRKTLPAQIPSRKAG